MRKLEPILQQQTASGLYRFTSRAQPKSILEEVAEHGWQGFFIDGQQVTDKQSFLTTASQAISFPGYFGNNWDAFEESIRDLAWFREENAPKGYVILYDQVIKLARREPESWSMVQETLQEAVDFWQTQQTPFYALFRGTWWYAREIPKV
ncbi:MAG: barstar family protein [Chloroflexota bacterium]